MSLKNQSALPSQQWSENTVSFSKKQTDVKDLNAHDVPSGLIITQR